MAGAIRLIFTVRNVFVCRWQHLCWKDSRPSHHKSFSKFSFANIRHSPRPVSPSQKTGADQLETEKCFLHSFEGTAKLFFNIFNTFCEIYSIKHCFISENIVLLLKPSQISINLNIIHQMHILNIPAQY